MVIASIGQIAMVDPYSGDMLPSVARSASVSEASPGPKNSTNFPTTPTRRSRSVIVETRSVAVVPSGNSPVSLNPITSGMSIETGWPMLIHWAVGGAVDVDGAHGHADRSYHRKDMGCKAVDFHFVTGAPVRLQYYEIGRVGFSGLGFYPDQNPPGWHVDTRPKDQTQRWTRKKGEYIYLL